MIRAATVLLLVAMLAPLAFAGGPLGVGGPSFGHAGVPLTWDPARMPIQYRVDPGPMATYGSTTVISNSAGLQRLQSMFGVWQAVPTAAVSFSNAGQLLATGSYVAGTDVKTVTQFNDLYAACKQSQQSPVIFDADGSLFAALGLPPEIIGFAGPCAMDSGSGFITAAFAMLNGKMQDGIASQTGPNYELTASEFDEAMVHEIGHYLGLDHSQINLDMLNANQYPCDVDGLAGLPVMFPELFCQARVDAGLPALAPDDVAAISTLYPSASFSTSYGFISGRIYFSDGVSQVQGANVIARAVDDPNSPEDESRRVAFSTVSGYLFTGNPGQSVTAVLGGIEDNTNGSQLGSRDAQLIGYYKIAVPPGTYTVEVESIYNAFVSDSGLGPLNPPVPLPGQAEFWNKDESAFDLVLQRDTIDISPGSDVTGVDIILNGTPARFDQYEDPIARAPIPGAPDAGLAAEVPA